MGLIEERENKISWLFKFWMKRIDEMKKNRRRWGLDPREAKGKESVFQFSIPTCH